MGDPENVEKGTPQEMVAALLPRVDGVAGPANGVPFLVIKAMEDQTNAAAIAGVIAEPTDVAKDLAANAAAAAEAPLPELLAEVVVPVATVGTPGSPEWEAADAANLDAAVALLLALKQRVEVAGDRERAEWQATDGTFDDLDNAWDLDDAACSLDWILGLLAKLAVTERAEAGDVAKSTTPANVTKAAIFMARLYRSAPPVTKSAASAAQEVPVVEPTIPAAVEKAADAPAADATPVVEAATETTATAPAADVAKAEGSAPAATETAPAATAEEVLKSLLAGDVFKSAIAAVVTEAVTAELADVRKSIEKIAETPQSAGPLVGGAAGSASQGEGRYELVAKHGPQVGVQTPSGVAGDPELVAKALAGISSPSERDQVARALAVSLHPLSSR